MNTTENRERKTEARRKRLAAYEEKDILLFSHLRNLHPTEAIRLKMFLVAYCEEGEVSLNLNNAPLLLSRGNVLVCLPHQPITDIECSRNLKIRVIGVSESLLQKLVYKGKSVLNIFFYIGKNPILPVSEQKLGRAAAYYELMEQKTANKQPFFQQEALMGLVQGMFYELLSDFAQCLPRPKEDLMRQGDIIFRKFVTLLMHTNGKNRTVAYFAEQLCISAKYLSLICKERSGQTTLQMIHSQTCHEIAFMLKNTEKSIKEIAEEMNFSNLSFFGKFVKQHLGMSPTEYRKRIGE